LTAAAPRRLGEADVVPGLLDSSNFPAATTSAAVLVEVEPGGLRELHWHPNADERTSRLSLGLRRRNGREPGNLSHGPVSALHAW